ELEIVDSFEFLFGDSIGFDQNTGNLFIGQTFVNSFFNPTFDGDTVVFEVTPEGEEISSFIPEEIRSAIGLTVLPNGNILISDVIDGRIVEYSPEGEIVPGGIDFSREEFGLDFDRDGLADTGDKSPPTSVIYNEDSDTIFVLNSRGPSIFEFDSEGNLLNTLDLTGVTPPGNGGPQGLAIDPVTGNFLIINDGRESLGEFASVLFEVTPELELVSSFNLAELTGFVDAEGLTTDPETGDLYVVFDSDTGSGDAVVRLDLLHAPELIDISKSGVEDTPISFTAEDFGDAFSDVDGDELESIIVSSLPDSGLLTLNGSRVREGQTISTADLDNLVYTPDEDFFGLDSFEVTASDGTRESETATVDLTVNSNSGISLEIVDSFEFLFGDSIGFDQNTGNLFIGQTFVNSFFNPTFDGDTVVFEVTPEGEEISSFIPEEIRSAIGLTVLPNGNILISDVIDGRIVEYSPEGEIVPGGIDFSREEFGLDFDRDGLADTGDKSPPTSVIYNEDSDTIFVLNSRGPSIFEFDSEGNLLNTLDLTGVTPPGNGGPQGLAIDPVTGNFLIINDGRESLGEFASVLFEVTPELELVSSFNLAELTGFVDAEGLTTDPETGDLYVVFDSDTGSGDAVVRLDLLHAPELDRIKKSANQDTPISFSEEDFSNAFSDPDEDELVSITIETAPEDGNLTLNGSRVRAGDTITAAELDELVYTPDEDFSGLDNFQISASDGSKSSETSSVDLLVNANEGLQFNFLSSFAGGGDGVAYLPSTGNIYAINTEVLGPGEFEWTVTEYTPEGVEVNEFTSELFTTALGGTALPNGNLLLLSPRFGQLVEFTPEGEEVVGGINIENEALAVPNVVLRGVVYDEASENIFVLDSSAIIIEIDSEGNILSTLDFSDTLPENISVQGITIDPLTGNFLIVDQFDNGANNSIYEVTPEGELVATTDLLALTGIDDPEGISIDPETRTVYVAFDDDGNNGSQI
ncbi:MAG: cadherin-like domain-containing protein, partial [Oscillatoria sp. PMC 1051.18]|nr:cadherin-like domain-containing protein [Oscillatoria sp. PMC 1051.18]